MIQYNNVFEKYSKLFKKISIEKMEDLLLFN